MGHVILMHPDQWAKIDINWVLIDLGIDRPCNVTFPGSIQGLSMNRPLKRSECI